MVKKALVWTALAAALVIPATGHAETYFDFQIGISNAPPPPRLGFYDEPYCSYLPAHGVYVVRHPIYDVFRHGGSYYACRDGYWYRARHHRGPFRVVDVRYVPRRILHVPAGYWKHRHGSGHGWSRGQVDGRRWAHRDRAFDHGRGGWNRGYDRDWRGGRDRGDDRRWARGRDQGERRSLRDRGDERRRYRARDDGNWRDRGGRQGGERLNRGRGGDRDGRGYRGRRGDGEGRWTYREGGRNRRDG